MSPKDIIENQLDIFSEKLNEALYTFNKNTGFWVTEISILTHHSGTSSFSFIDKNQKQTDKTMVTNILISD